MPREPKARSEASEGSFPRGGALRRDLAIPRTSKTVSYAPSGGANSDPEAVSDSAPSPVTLTKRWTTFRCSPEIQLALKEIFSHEHPQARFIQSFKSGEWNGRVNFFQRSRVATGLFLEYRTVVERKFSLYVTDLRVFPKFQKESL